MNKPVYGCAGCSSTAGAGGCPVHRNLFVNTQPVAPVPDWNVMFPNINKKYSDLLQSHHTLCGKVELFRSEGERLKKELDAAVLQLKASDFAGKQMEKERDDALRLNRDLKDAAQKMLTILTAVKHGLEYTDEFGGEIDAACIAGHDVLNENVKRSDPVQNGGGLCTCGAKFLPVDHHVAGCPIRG